MQEFVSLDPHRAKDMRDLVGGYNDAPPNMRDIDEDTFFNELTTWAWSLYDSRQVTNKEQPLSGFRKMQLWLHGNGDGIGFWCERVSPTEFKRHYFRFGPCVHRYQETMRARCYREMRCVNCGHRTAIDSSD